MSPRVATPPPRVVPIEVVDDEPVAHRTRSRISALLASGRNFPSEFLEQWAASEVLHINQWAPLALSVLNTETVESLEHRTLLCHPKMDKTWNTSYINELGQQCQVIGTNPTDPTKKRVNSIDNFHVICYEDIPIDRRKGIKQ